MLDELSGTLIRMLAEHRPKRVIIDCCLGMAPAWLSALTEMALFDYPSITEAEENAVNKGEV